MQDNIRSYINVGDIHFMSYPSTMRGEGPILETVTRLINDDYFDAIEITHIADDEVRAKVAKLIKESRIKAYYGGQPRHLTTGQNANDLDEEKRVIAEKTLLDAIDEAYELGCLGFGFLSGKYEEVTKQQSYEQLLKTTRNLCDYAASKGDMMIALEVFDYDIDKCSLIGPAPYAKQFAEDMRKTHKNFGLMVDLSHLPILHETSADLEILKDYICHVHIGNAVLPEMPKDAPAYGDAHPRFGFPGSANDVAELAEFLRTLIRIGYLKKGEPKTVSFEVKPWGDEDPEAILAHSKRTLNAAWPLV